MTSKFVRPWRISLLLPGRKRQPYMEGYYSPSLRRAWGVQSKRVISRTIFYGILNSSWFSSEIGVASVSSSQPSLTTMEVSLEEALALQRKGLLEVSYRFPNDPAAAAAETFEAHPFTPPEEHPESYYRRQIPKIVGGKIVVMDDKDTQSYIQTVLPSGSEAWFVKNTAGVLNHKEFLWRQYPKITTWGEEPYRPYDPRQNHPDFPPYKGGRYDDYDLRKAESETLPSSFQAYKIGDTYKPEEVYEIASSSQMRGPQSWDYQHYQNPEDDRLLGGIMRTPEWELIRFDERVLREKPITHADCWIGTFYWPEPIRSNTPIVIQHGMVIDGNHRLASALTWGQSVLAFVPKGEDWWIDGFDEDEMKEWNDELDESLGHTHRAETDPPKTSKGLVVYPQRMAELIRDGDKTMIVKDKPLDLAGKRYTIVAKRKGYAYIQLGAMQTLTLPKFKALNDKHLITPDERAKYFKGKRRLYAWPVKVLREFDKPYPTNAPLRPQDIAPKLKTYATETFEAPSVRLASYRPIINELQWNTDYLVTNDFLDEHFIDGGILNHSDWDLIDWSNPHPTIQKRKQQLKRREETAKRRKSFYRYRMRREKERLEEMEAEVVY